MLFDQLNVDWSFEGLWEGSEDNARCRVVDRRSSPCDENNWLWDQDTLRSSPSKVEQPNRDGDSVS